MSKIAALLSKLRETSPTCKPLCDFGISLIDVHSQITSLNSLQTVYEGFFKPENIPKAIKSLEVIQLACQITKNLCMPALVHNLDLWAQTVKDKTDDFSHTQWLFSKAFMIPIRNLAVLRFQIRMFEIEDIHGYWAWKPWGDYFYARDGPRYNWACANVLEKFVKRACMAVPMRFSRYRDPAALDVFGSSGKIPAQYIMKFFDAVRDTMEGKITVEELQAKAVEDASAVLSFISGDDLDNLQELVEMVANGMAISSLLVCESLKRAWTLVDEGVLGHLFTGLAIQHVFR